MAERYIPGKIVISSTLATFPSNQIFVDHPTSGEGVGASGVIIGAEP